LCLLPLVNNGFSLSSFLSPRYMLYDGDVCNSLKRSFYLMVVSLHYIIIFFLCVSYSLLFTGYPQDFLESIIQAVFILFLIFLSFRSALINLILFFKT
jgi:hypothetical protein